MTCTNQARSEQPVGVIQTASETSRRNQSAAGTPRTRRDRASTVWRDVEDRAAPRDGVVSRTELRELGVTRAAVRNRVERGHWRLHGSQTVATHRLPLTETAHGWRAIWETGTRIAALDGATALRASGLTGFTDDTIHVSIPHGSDPGHVPGVTLHRVVCRPEGHLLDVGVPRTRPAIAAVRAAQWARSDRQAALLLVLGVQQRLMTSDQLRDAARTVRGRTRRALIPLLVQDICAGAQSLGEIDFAALCRVRGIPEPTRQSVRQGPRGRVYLDVEWPEIGLVVEIDGAGHRFGLAVTDDNLRQNSLVIDGRWVLRIDVIGLRIEEDAFMEQVLQLHRQLSGSPSPVRGDIRRPGAR